MMPADDGRIPDTVTLCSHHEAVVSNLDHLDATDHRDTDNARAEFAKQCCNQGRRLA
jgi:hypothetical protein